MTCQNIKLHHKYRLEVPEHAPSLSGMGLQLGYSGFSRDQNDNDSLGVYVLRSEHEDNSLGNSAIQSRKIIFIFT